VNFKKQLFKIYFGGLILIPIVLLVLPSNYFDNGQSVCVSVLLFDQECYGCGMTRGIQHLLHLDFLTAYEFNKLSLIVLPLLVYLWFNELRRIKKLIKNVP
jgi:hypothetical protein